MGEPKEPLFAREDVRRARRESFQLILQAERVLGALEAHSTQMEQLLHGLAKEKETPDV